MVVAVPKDRSEDGFDGATGRRRHQLAKDGLAELAGGLLFGAAAEFRRVPHVAPAPVALLAVHVVQQRWNDLVLDENSLGIRERKK